MITAPCSPAVFENKLPYLTSDPSTRCPRWRPRPQGLFKISAMISFAAPGMVFVHSDLHFLGCGCESWWSTMPAMAVHSEPARVRKEGSVMGESHTKDEAEWWNETF
ncbi:hypothetical protein V6N11_036589 [Hibiscus sabdariffa]|uniref:Uncharacterized protein n=1 Tax=Hibiscus sabdariffa TaxID=183260 RepID=A0ABR2RBM5_9ROSI